MLFIVDQGKERLNFFNIGTAETVTSVRYMAEAVVKRQVLTSFTRESFSGEAKVFGRRTRLG